MPGPSRPLGALLATALVVAAALRASPAHAQLQVVEALPGWPGPLPQRQWAGYLSTAGSSSTEAEGAPGIWSWLLAADEAADEKPLILWLQGGPGCSGTMGVFQEWGPFYVNNDRASLRRNPHSWTRRANVLVVDQPLGTGFSVLTGALSGRHLARTLGRVASDMANALGAFYTQFPEFAGRPLFIMGESYGGKFVPHVATEVQRRGDARMRLEGIAIGDGVTDPLTQTQAIPDQAYSLGLLDHSELGLLHGYSTACERLVSARQWAAAADQCSAIIDYLAFNATDGINIDDVRSFGIFDPSQPFPYYMQRRDVQVALHVAEEARGPSVWAVCNFTVQAALTDEAMKSAAPLMPPLLAAMRVLIYNGQFDLNVGWVGTYAYLRKLEWPGQAEYRAARKQVWKVRMPGAAPGGGGMMAAAEKRRPRPRQRGRRHYVDDESHEAVAGYVIAARNLTSVMVVASGHMMPKNQPAFALDLLGRFLDARRFGDGPAVARRA